MNGLSYAYLGDAVYEVMIREYLIDKNIFNIKKLHNLAVKFTNAKSQSLAIEELILTKQLTIEEEDYFKLGRNSSAKQGKKTATVKEYKYATGLESLLGYLYINNEQRFKEITNKIINIIEVKQNA